MHGQWWPLIFQDVRAPRQPPMEFNSNDMNNISKFFRICLEGNIGSGKSSLLNLLLDRYPTCDPGIGGSNVAQKFKAIQFEEEIPMIVTPEPIQQWTKLPVGKRLGETENLLERMYQDPTRWAFVFEHYSQYTRFQQMSSTFDHFKRSSTAPGLHLMERSIYSNRFCFIENFHLSDTISDVEYNVLNAWFEHLQSKPELFVDLFIYLRADPEIIHQRIVSRARNEENAIPLQYLQDIHRLHEKTFVDKLPSIWMQMPEYAEVVVLDANQPLNVVFDDFLRKLKNWIADQFENFKSEINN